MRFLALIIYCITFTPAFSEVDLVIRNGLVYDGSGEPPKFADIGIEKGRIISVAARIPQSKMTLDAKGMAVAPGFIDVHTHAENILSQPKGENFLRMGVTTLVLGNCGSSKLNLADFFIQLSEKGFSPNIASLILSLIHI